MMMFQLWAQGNYYIYSTFNDEIEFSNEFGALDMKYNDVKLNSITINGINYMSPELLLKLYKKLKTKIK